MTVAELIKRLRKENPAAVVLVLDDRGDLRIATDLQRSHSALDTERGHVMTNYSYDRPGLKPTVELV